MLSQTYLPPPPPPTPHPRPPFPHTLAGPWLYRGVGCVFPFRAQELCESGGGRPGLPSSPYGLCGRKATLKYGASELGSCVKEGVDILGSPPLIVLMVSVDVKQH